MRALVLVTLVLGLSGCNTGPNRHDVYMEALQVEGEAERGVCQLTFDGGMRAQTISGDQIQECLAQQERALELYAKAGELGMKGDVEFERTLARAKERKQKLDEMLSNLRRMERVAASGPE